MALKFCPLFSGSDGNCTFVGTDNTNILIDAGGSGKQILSALETIGVDPKDIDALIVTHEHTDHVKGAGVISRKLDIPIYATDGTWYAMSIGGISPSNMKVISSGEPFVINDMVFTPFDTSHDALEPVGIHMKAGDLSAAIATDTGFATEDVREYISDADILLLEANYDKDMLRQGSYTYALKKRILSEKGHLCNEDTAELVSSVAEGKLKKLYLGHLSQENNNPVLAYKTVRRMVSELCRVDVQKEFMMEVAMRYKVSSFTKLEK